MSRDDLIARLKAATGPDRELDARLCIALGLSRDNVMVGVGGWCINSETNPNPYKSPAYTASIDAALTLVPEGWLWRIMPSDFDGWLAEVWTDDTLDCEFGVRAKTPALAICIAALRAREVVS